MTFIMRWIGLDLDGTLITCRHRQSAVLQAACPRPITVDTSLVWEAKRDGATTIEALRAQGVSSGQSERIAERWRRMIEEPYWLGLDSLFEDVLEQLAGLRARGMRIALLTARERAYSLRQQLRQLGLAGFCDEVFIVSPRYAAEQKARVLARLDPIAMIGDTESDATAAAAVGTPFLAVESGQRSCNFLRRHGVRECHPGFQQAVAAVIGT